MAEIRGTNLGGFGLHVNEAGQAEARAVSVTGQSNSSQRGEAFNINTGTFTLTDANATGVIYLKNVSEPKDIIINRVFVTFGASNGTGPVFGSIERNPTSGSLLSGGTDFLPANFNFGSSQTIGVELKKGATGQTVTGGLVPPPVEFYFNAANSRHLIGFESIVLPLGASCALVITPPAGNTSMDIQAGMNCYLAEPQK